MRLVEKEPTITKRKQTRTKALGALKQSWNELWRPLNEESSQKETLGPKNKIETPQKCCNAIKNIFWATETTQPLKNQRKQVKKWGAGGVFRTTPRQTGQLVLIRSTV